MKNKQEKNIISEKNTLFIIFFWAYSRVSVLAFSISARPTKDKHRHP
jgi:hypothetical protein